MALDGERIQVQERVYKRILNTPKNGKTREGAISDGTLSLLKEWADLAEEPSAEGFVSGRDDQGAIEEQAADVRFVFFRLCQTGEHDWIICSRLQLRRTAD